MTDVLRVNNEEAGLYNEIKGMVERKANNGDNYARYLKLEIQKEEFGDSRGHVFGSSYSEDFLETHYEDYLRLVKNNQASAMAYLGGRPIKKVSVEEALEYRRKATLKYHPVAIAQMGNYYYNRGNDKYNPNPNDVYRGLSLLKIAAENGSFYAIKRFNEIGGNTSSYSMCYPRKTSSSSSDSSSGSSCFITTAVCKCLDKSDDCEELTILRNYRDNWLKEQPDGKKLIAEYYHIAPKIVAAIEERVDRENIYRGLLDDYIIPCVEDIKIGKNENAKERYIMMVEKLRKKYVDSNRMTKISTTSYDFLIAIDDKNINDMKRAMNEFADYGYEKVECRDYNGNTVVIYARKNNVDVE